MHNGLTQHVFSAQRESSVDSRGLADVLVGNLVGLLAKDT